jgi:hypothetical protein
MIFMPPVCTVGAEDLCHQAIFVDHAGSAVAPPDADPAGAVLHHGQDVSLRAVEQVGGEEVQRQDPLRLRSQELRPARTVPAVDRPGG